MNRLLSTCGVIGVCLIQSSVAIAQAPQTIWGGATAVVCSGITRDPQRSSVIIFFTQAKQVPGTDDVDEYLEEMRKLKTSTREAAEKKRDEDCGRGCLVPDCLTYSIRFGVPEECPDGKTTDNVQGTKLGGMSVRDAVDGSLRVRGRTRKYNFFGAGAAFKEADVINPRDLYTIAKRTAVTHLVARGRSLGLTEREYKKIRRERRYQTKFDLRRFTCVEPPKECPPGQRFGMKAVGDDTCVAVGVDTGTGGGNTSVGGIPNTDVRS